MKEEMKAQKIIITGGATRIGAAIAEDLANDKNQITIHYNKSKKKAEQLKNILKKKRSKIFLIKADLNKISELNKIIKFANVKMKGVNCLINNASLFENDSIKNFIAEHISFVSTLFFNNVERYCFLKCFADCLIFFTVGPGAIPFTLIFGAKLIAEVFVKV